MPRYPSAVIAAVCLGVVSGLGLRVAAGAPAAPRPQEWRALFDGGSTDAFRGWISGVLPKGWHVVDGTLVKDGPVEDLLTREQFRNFELEFEWKVGRGSNSGVFYRGTRDYEHLYWSAPEYQLLDDGRAPDGRSALTSSGADYGLYPSRPGTARGFGEWNIARILVNGTHVEHWLNGVRVVSYDLGSDDWKTRVARSKFASYPKYGAAKRGYIGTQGDHAGSVALRNIRVRELP